MATTQKRCLRPRSSQLPLLRATTGIASLVAIYRATHVVRLTSEYFAATQSETHRNLVFWSSRAMYVQCGREIVYSIWYQYQVLRTGITDWSMTLLSHRQWSTPKNRWRQNIMWRAKKPNITQRTIYCTTMMWSQRMREYMHKINR